MIGKAWWLSAALLLLASTTEARVTRIEITRQEPFAGGEDFGVVGPYEKLVLSQHGAPGWSEHQGACSAVGRPAFCQAPDQGNCN
jgi:hypothetical protein